MVISDSKTATQMRKEMVETLTLDIATAERQLQNIGAQARRVDVATRCGYLNALKMQLDFWKNVVVEGKIYVA